MYGRRKSPDFGLGVIVAVLFFVEYLLELGIRPVDLWEVVLAVAITAVG